jgi:hypothetical protein
MIVADETMTDTLTDKPWGDDLNLIPYSWGRDEKMSVYQCMDRLEAMTDEEKHKLWTRQLAAHKTRPPRYDEHLRFLRSQANHFDEHRPKWEDWPNDHSDVNRVAALRPGFSGYANSTDAESLSREQAQAIWHRFETRAKNKLAKAEARYDENGLLAPSPNRTEKRSRVTAKQARAVTTKTYTRFQPHPRKHRTNAAKQKAYRDRLREASSA